MVYKVFDRCRKFTAVLKFFSARLSAHVKKDQGLNCKRGLKMRDYSCAFVHSRAAQLMELEHSLSERNIMQIADDAIFCDESKMCAKTALE